MDRILHVLLGKSSQRATAAGLLRLTDGRTGAGAIVGRAATAALACLLPSHAAFEGADPRRASQLLQATGRKMNGEFG
jgi:hypothetical protein